MGCLLRATICVLLPALVLGGPLAAQSAGREGPIDVIMASAEVAEEELLDVGIQVFEAGLLEEDEDALEKKGVFAEIRRSESRFIPIHLMRTLQSTGFWGAVRVVPEGADSVDLTLDGEILESTGMELVLRVDVTDATGRLWYKQRYKEKADTRAYREDGFEERDPYQQLYNRIANDLLAARRKIAADEVARLRRIAQLRFAADLAPDAYAEYLTVDKKGRLQVVRLPAEDDPMMARIAGIRERDYMFVDTLNEYFADFYAQMEEPYDDWRSFSYDEQKALRQLRRTARLEKILGAIALVGGVAIEGSSTAARAGRTAATIGGAAALQDGMAKSKEAKIHVEALKELAQSLDSEMAPLLVDLQGETLRLGGSVESQYSAWRDLLRRLFVTETGLAIDPNTGEVATAGDVED